MGELTRIKIGSWSATPELNLLERGMQQIKIEPRAMDVLFVLARHDGAVVSVEQLIATAWKGVVVGDGSVYLAIRQLRQVLDDSADGVRHIETIPKRGYRLTVPVAIESAAIEAARGAPASSPAARLLEAPIHTPAGFPVARRRRWWLAAAGTVASIGAAIFFGLRSDAPPTIGNSVAVLPFENLSSDPEQEYFADGVTAEILNALARVSDLRVTAQTSSFVFKNRHDSPAAIGASLGVEHLLQGSVRKAGDQLRIAAHLSHARTGEQLWSESYERRLDDIFRIQDEIAAAVASALQVKLGVGNLGRAPGMTRNVAAYDEYLRGAARVRAGTPDSMPLGIAHLQRAVALDPSFSIAWNGLGMTYANAAGVLPNRAAEWVALGADALERARSLTPDAPHVLLSTGVLETRRGRWLDAAPIFEQFRVSSLRYGMGNEAWGPRGTFLAYVGRLRDAMPLLERARAEDPLAPNVAIMLSLAYIASGNFSDAYAEIDRGLEVHTRDTPLLVSALLIALNQGDRTEIDERMRALPDQPSRLARLIDAPDGASAEIRRMASRASPIVKSGLAQYAAYFREPELALELWSEGIRDPDDFWQPMMRDVRRLPVFREVVRDIGLVDYWRAYGWSDFCRPLGDDDFACE